tara:strand:- start:210 stop:776 length:567 start_codon:yes stop_codon:yes gene_type:complete
MTYTFKPEQEHAKAYGDNLGVSTKNSIIICRAINNKKLTVARRLLEDVISEKRSLKGKYYTNATTAILELLGSCEKNAEFMGLEMDKLFVHAGATHGVNRRRRRRKSGYGTAMKLTNVEIMLIQKGKEKVAKEKTAKKPVKKEEKIDLKKEVEVVVREKAKEIKIEPKKEEAKKEEAKKEEVPKEEKK